MARKEKELFDADGNDVRDIGYYYTPSVVSHFIQKSMLEIKSNIKSVLDPAVGKEELLDIFIEKKLEIDSFDIVKLKETYNSNFTNTDFIDFIIENFTSDLFGDEKLHHDAIIMNPPYNCHEVDYIKKNKARLTNYFSDTKALNMYSMFMDAVISNSKNGAIIGMIVSDSFVTNKMHKALREKIRANCKIHYLLLCPTNLFWSQKADVRTCILILEKTNQKSNTDFVNVLQRHQSIDNFYKALSTGDFQTCSNEDLFLSHKSDNNEIVIEVPHEIRFLFNNSRLGEVFPCITGISTGNDELYLSKRKSDKYPHPFYKNPGSKKFRCDPQNYLIENFLEISKVEKTFMVRNKKYLGEKGITCSSMGVKFSACELPEGSTFGVNPNIFPPEKDIGWLCSYLNSSLVQYLLRGVIVRSNMVTSGYVSRIPLIDFSDETKIKLNYIHECVKQQRKSQQDAIKEIDDTIYSSLGLSEQTVRFVTEFCSKIYRNS